LLIIFILLGFKPLDDLIFLLKATLPVNSAGIRSHITGNSLFCFDAAWNLLTDDICGEYFEHKIDQ